MRNIYAVINQKGGVGKSTTSLALGAGLSQRDFKVLCVDMDAQGNLSYTMRADGEHPSTMDLLTGTPVLECIQQGSFADLIAASPELATADLTLTDTGKEYRLRESLAPILDEYDYIVLDTPPALGILTVSALTCATDAVIPAQADIYSLQGIGQLYGTLSAVVRYTNPGLTIAGILLTRYNARAILSRDITETIEATAQQLKTRVFNAKIRETIAVKEAQAQQQDLFSYAPRCNATVDYAALLEEILERSDADGQEELQG